MATSIKKALVRLGKWRDKRRYRLREIAKATGLSMATLSGCINSPELVSEKTAAAILGAQEPAV